MYVNFATNSKPVSLSPGIQWRCAVFLPDSWEGSPRLQPWPGVHLCRSTQDVPRVPDSACRDHPPSQKDQIYQVRMVHPVLDIAGAHEVPRRFCVGRTSEFLNYRVPALCQDTSHSCLEVTC